MAVPGGQFARHGADGSTHETWPEWFERRVWRPLKAIALALFLVFSGGFLAVAAREAVLSNARNLEYIALILFIVAQSLIFVALNRNLRRRFDALQLSAIISAVSAAFAVTIILMPDLARLWNRYLGTVLISLHTELSSDDSGPLEGFSNRASEVINQALAAFVAGTVITVAVVSVPLLPKIWAAIGLSERQLSLAKRMRQPASGAIPHNGALSQVYTKEVSIDRFSIRRQLPFVNGGGNRARVKLIIHEHPPEYEGADFSWGSVSGLLKSAEIELTQSLFFVYLLKPDLTPTVVCYGTGAELERLMTMQNEVSQQPGDTVAQRFLGAMNRNDKLGVVSVVDRARQIMLRRHPHAEVLLSTAMEPESEEMQIVLSAMDESGLNRILLISDKVPIERGIIGAAEISKFLLGDQQ